MGQGSRACAQTSPPHAATVWYTRPGSGAGRGPRSLSQGQEKLRLPPPSPEAAAFQTFP